MLGLLLLFFFSVIKSEVSHHSGDTAVQELLLHLNFLASHMEAACSSEYSPVSCPRQIWSLIKTLFVRGDATLYPSLSSRTVITASS